MDRNSASTPGALRVQSAYPCITLYHPSPYITPHPSPLAPASQEVKAKKAVVVMLVDLTDATGSLMAKVCYEKSGAVPDTSSATRALQSLWQAQ